MSLSIGIVGLPNVGKSTLFNALTKKTVSAENYPFCTIDPSVGVVSVPDERLSKLSEFSESDKTVPAAVEFVDIAGLVKGASEGEGLGNQFLANIREVDAIAQVVRIFEDDKVIHVSGKVDPIFDIEVINLELSTADLQTVSKRLDKIARDVKRGDKEALLEQVVLEKFKKVLSEGGLAHQVVFDEKELPKAQSLHLLTFKPVLYVLNKKAGGKNLDEMEDERFIKLKEYFKKTDSKWVVVDAGIEHELKDFESEEKTEMRKALLGESSSSDSLESKDGVDDLISKGYELLGLMTFFTTGKTETRAWTIKKNSTAPVAGAAIHTDFKDKFIRADVISFKKLLEAGSYARAREQGLVRTEGKEYVVEDGDVIEFKI